MHFNLISKLKLNIFLQIVLYVLALFISLVNTQQPSAHYFLTDFDNSNGQFRQQFFDTFGNAHGVYSYVNPSGQLVRVQYSTGVQPLARTFSLLSLPSASLPRYTTSPRNDLYNTGRNITASLSNLFTPATVQYPAASAGQLENYRKALEQYANEINKQIFE